MPGPSHSPGSGMQRCEHMAKPRAQAGCKTSWLQGIQVTTAWGRPCYCSRHFQGHHIPVSFDTIMSLGNSVRMFIFDSNVQSKHCSFPLQNPRQKDNDEIQLLVLQHLINADIFTGNTKYFVGVNMTHTGLTGPPKLFPHHANKGRFALASYLIIDCTSLFL